MILITITKTLKESKIRAFIGNGGENPVGFVSGLYVAVLPSSISHRLY